MKISPVLRDTEDRVIALMGEHVAESFGRQGFAEKKALNLITFVDPS